MNSVIEEELSSLDSHLHPEPGSFAIKDSAQYGYRSMEESAPVKSSKHPFGFGRKDPVKEHITDPVKKNIVDPVKKNIGSPEDGIRQLDRDDPLNANDLDRSEY